MTDTTASTKKTTVRVPRIVLDRPPFSLSRFLTYTALGLVIGFVLGFGLSWVENTTRGVAIFEEQFAYLLPLAFLGLIAGMLFGWSWHREVTARHEVVEIASTTREQRRRARRSVSRETTEIVRY